MVAKKTKASGTSPRRQRPAAAAKSASQTAAHGSSIDVAFQQLRQLIVHGKLAPGTWIIEADLSRRLGMSRTPVRSALQWLQREGYVTEQKARLNSKILVAPLTHDDARELYAIVARIEGLAGRHAAQLPRKQRESIVDAAALPNETLRQIASSGDVADHSIFELDMSFHGGIVESAAGPRLKALHSGIKPQTERYWRLYASNILDKLHIAVEEHDRILLAIREGEPEQAEAAMVANWINGAERIGKVIAQRGDLGTW